MKRIITIASIGMLLCNLGFSSDTIPGRIIFYRKHIVQGAYVSHRVKVNDSLVVNLDDNSFFEYECKPGAYSIGIDNDPEMHLEVKPGRTYYLMFGVASAYFTSNYDFTVVDSVSAYPAISDMRMRKLDSNIAKPTRYKNRIGGFFGFEFGFDEIPMYMDMNGDYSSLNFGSGLAFGASYSREIFRYFTVDVGVTGAYTSLTPYMDDIDVTFGRCNVWATPYLTIPFKLMYDNRLKFGFGPDYYWMVKLTKSSEQYYSKWFNDTWQYENTLGYHSSIKLEIDATEKTGAFIQLDWNVVQYKFVSSKKRYYVPEKLKSPDGSNISLLMGVYFFF